MTTELAAASILDMKWHELASVSVPADSPLASETVSPEDAARRLIDIEKFEAQARAQMGLCDYQR